MIKATSNALFHPDLTKMKPSLRIRERSLRKHEDNMLVNTEIILLRLEELGSKKVSSEPFFLLLWSEERLLK